MKTNKIALALIGLSSLATLTLTAGPSVSVQIGIPAPVVVAPAPEVVVETVPDTYVWDGVEFVGVVGNDYYYLGPDKVWLRFDEGRMVRFHEWERHHGDWRDHAIRNEIYRRDAHGHEVLRHDAKQEIKHDDHEINHDAHEIRHDAKEDAHEIRHDAKQDVHDQEKQDNSHDKDKDNDHGH